MLDFADAHPDALHRSCVDGHLTGSALVVDADAAQVLVLFHTKLQRWLQPGGHADGDADLAAGGAAGGHRGDGDRGAPGRPAARSTSTSTRSGRPRSRAHLHLDVRFVVVAPPGRRGAATTSPRPSAGSRSGDLAELGADAGLLRLADRGLVAVRARV